ncbi:beta-mannosidase [Tahibacter amnicola]|uniref:Beta-mannosidase B n=1 Tax=Tahibacter amnicola TaxID=2976241 RepID=A0ABY6BMZ5_9GAMM|nr:glycoside hydrolase family 2 protein [Tahibacter amnicola]UXI70430.1 glycoside hydrolase family 2 protein [Tahibacter amnicola]
MLSPSRWFCVVLLSLLPVAGSLAAPPLERTLHDGWWMRLHAAAPDTQVLPEWKQWQPARVPGEVHTDLLAAGLITDPFLGAAEAGLQWIGLADWEYQRTFDLDARVLGRRHLDLIFEGLDTFATVELNGQVVLQADNMHRRWRVPAKELLRKRNTLRIVFASPIRRVLPSILATPRTQWLPGNYNWSLGDEPDGAQTTNYVRKAQYHYGWDWGPRYVTAGIWRPVRLQAWDDVRIDDLHVRQEHVDADEARLTVELTVEADRRRRVPLRLQYRTPDGDLVAVHSERVRVDAGTHTLRFPVRIARPQRWFPVGYGEPSLYTFEALVAGDTAQRRTGLRQVALRRERDAWGREMAFVVNGIPIFAKGANVIPFDSFASRVDRARYTQRLNAAREDNMNLLRVWGGGYYESDDFYELADELGLLVWQDFMFGGGVPPADDPLFRANVLAEAHDQLRRLRHHPSIVLWCGNNEIEVGWQRWGDRKTFRAQAPERAQRVWEGYRLLFGEMLRNAVAQYDSDVPYWSSSPGADLEGDPDVPHDGDRHAWNVWGSSAPIESWLDETPRFLSEYGLQSLPSMNTLRRFAGPQDLRADSPVMIAHQKYAAGAGNERILHYVRTNYGEPRNFEAFVYLSQVMQAEGIALAALHQRSQRPRSMGSLYWQFNDVWPGASWSAIDYYGQRKALAYHTRRFYAPLTIAPLRRNEATNVWVVSDHTAAMDAHWRLRVMDFDGTVHHAERHAVSAQPLASTRVATMDDRALLRGADPGRTVAVFELLVGESVVARQELYFRAAATLELPVPGLSATVTSDAEGLSVALRTEKLARAVWLETEGAEASFEDNALTLLPGESRAIRVRTAVDAAALRRALRVRDLHDATLSPTPTHRKD